MKLDLITLPLDPVDLAALRSTKARAFADYLSLAGRDVFAQLVRLGRVSHNGDEVVVLNVSAERPQKPAHDIRKVEPLAVTFAVEDSRFPEVLSLRTDFPKVPHLLLRDAELPRSLCLYDQPYETVRLQWTPANFLSRIRYWLAMTAKGRLHAEDQPLEPLVVGCGIHLVLPSDFDPATYLTKPRLMDVFISAMNNEIPTFKALWHTGQLAANVKHIAAVYSCLPQTHGIISRQPQNLFDLDAICKVAGLNLIDNLTKTIQEWQRTRPTPGVLDTHLVIILLLPKKRHEEGPTENIDTQAFLTGKTIREIGIALGAMENLNGQIAYVMNVKPPTEEVTKKISTLILHVNHALNPTVAAVLNDCTPNDMRIVGIGMGTLGAQTFNNLVRSGFGRWTLVDDDTFLPHNCARHYLSALATGMNKAEAMTAIANTICEGSQVATAIPANVLTPGKHSETVKKAVQESALVLDFSASVAVARHLANENTLPRAMCAYMTPTGDGAIIAAEDVDRNVRLDWLEMLHYRSILSEKCIRESLRPRDGRYRYGNSCRDISVQLAQDDAAMWAAVVSRSIKQLAPTKKAVLEIYTRKPDGTTAVVRPQVTAPTRLALCEWTVCFDQWLLTKLARFRRQRLPNETGGVIVGSFDTQRRTCMLVDAIPSPPDSTEWPTSYIRGCEGLAAKVKEIGTLTAEQLGYVGEWHSHPDGFSTHPSYDDYEAYAWLVGHMNLEALPGIMLIVGQNREIRLVSTERG